MADPHDVVLEILGRRGPGVRGPGSGTGARGPGPRPVVGARGPRPDMEVLVEVLLSNGGSAGGSVIKRKHTIPYPEIPNFQFLVFGRSGLEKGSDYGLLKKCQNEKMQFFKAKKTR